MSPSEAARRLGRKQLTIVILMTIARLVCGFLLIVLMMSLVPEQPEASLVFPILVATGGILLYIWYFSHQLKGVYKARYPTLRAIEALVLVAAMFLAIFAMVYVMISATDPEAFTEVLDEFSAYYFSLTVLATVGFGDITPVTTMARSVTMVQMALDIAFIAILIRVMGSAAKRALMQRERQPGPIESAIDDSV